MDLKGLRPFWHQRMVMMLPLHLTANDEVIIIVDAPYCFDDGRIVNARDQPILFAKSILKLQRSCEKNESCIFFLFNLVLPFYCTCQVWCMVFIPTTMHASGYWPRLTYAGILTIFLTWTSYWISYSDLWCTEGPCMVPRTPQADIRRNLFFLGTSYSVKMTYVLRTQGTSRYFFIYFVCVCGTWYFPMYL